MVWLRAGCQLERGVLLEARVDHWLTTDCGEPKEEVDRIRVGSWEFAGDLRR